MASGTAPNTPTPQSGVPLKNYLSATYATVRVVASILVTAKIAKDPTGAGALRYLGAQLMGLAPKVAAFFEATFATGVFTGLGFTVADYNAAITRATDAHEADTQSAVLAKDAHSTAVAAMQTLAGMTLKIMNSYFFTMKMPNADPQIQSTLQAAGAPLDKAAADIKAGRKSSRAVSATLKDNKTTITTQGETIQQLQTESAMQQAEDKLKLQSLTGEPLTAKDLVVADLPASPAQGQPAPAQPTPHRGRTAQHIAIPAAASPTASARRNSPR